MEVVGGLVDRRLRTSVNSRVSSSSNNNDLQRRLVLRLVPRLMPLRRRTIHAVRRRRVAQLLLLLQVPVTVRVGSKHLQQNPKRRAIGELATPVTPRVAKATITALVDVAVVAVVVAAEVDVGVGVVVLRALMLQILLVLLLPKPPACLVGQPHHRVLSEYHAILTRKRACVCDAKLGHS